MKEETKLEWRNRYRYIKSAKNSLGALIGLFLLPFLLLLFSRLLWIRVGIRLFGRRCRFIHLTLATATTLRLLLLLLLRLLLLLGGLQSRLSALLSDHLGQLCIDLFVVGQVRAEEADGSCRRGEWTPSCLNAGRRFQQPEDSG